jgi:hypothetical protein
MLGGGIENPNQVRPLLGSPEARLCYQVLQPAKEATPWHKTHSPGAGLDQVAWELDQNYIAHIIMTSQG